MNRVSIDFNNKVRYFSIFFIFFILLSGCLSDNKNSSKARGETTYHPSPKQMDDYFQEIGQQAGLNFVHSIGDDDLTNIIFSSGGGTAFLDYDQDGFIDIFACSGTWLEGFSKSAKTC